MKIKVKLSQLLGTEFQPTIKKVMAKWREPKDIFTWVRIMQELDKVIAEFTEVDKKFVEDFGYDVNGTKQANLQALTAFLMQKHGKPGQDGKFSLSGVPESSVRDFLDEKLLVEKCLNDYNDAQEKALSEEREFELPRLIKVTAKDVQKEVISGLECYLLLPLLDLSEVGLKEDGDKTSKPVEDAD